MNEEDFIFRLENEILHLEKKIDNYESDYEKFKRLIKLKKLLIKTKVIAPFLIMAAMTLELGNALNAGVPFVRNELWKYEKTKKVFDTNGNITYEKFFHNERKANTIAYYSKGNNDIWDVNVYKIRKMTEEEILQLFDNNNVNLEDLFGEPIESYELMDPKLNAVENDFIEATIYDVDKSVAHSVMETKKENVIITFAYIAAILFSEIPIFVLNDLTKEINEEKIKKLEYCIDNYPDLEILKQKLKVKNDNYKYLTR